jgi:hypothetical protein
LIIAPYSPNRLYDEYFEAVVLSVKKRLAGDDDAIVFCFGTAGVGKTSLMFHAYELYASEPRLSAIALTRKDFARSLYELTGYTKEPFVGNDEGNVSRREAMTQWNRDIMDLYFSIRGKRAFHWWNNPSIDYIDRVFIEERVKLVVFCFSKGRTIRKYRLFTKDGMLRMLDKEGDLKTYTVRKHGHKYAAFEGWFKAYKGDLWKAYGDKKDERMDEKLSAFHRKYALGKGVSMASAAALLSVKDSTVKRALVWAAKNKVLRAETDYSMRGSRWVISEDSMPKIRQILEIKPYSKRYKGNGAELGAVAAPQLYTREEKKISPASSEEK